MGCGCTKRLEWMLKQAGYVHDNVNGVWRHANGMIIADEEVQADHARVARDELKRHAATIRNWLASQV